MIYNRVMDTFEELQLHGKTVFTINDASMLMKKPKKYVSKILSSNRKVKRIERGLYFISSSGGDNLYEIASQIVFPSYISLFAAFQYYSVTDQVIKKYSVISIKRHREVNLGENIIEFRTIVVPLSTLCLSFLEYFLHFHFYSYFKDVAFHFPTSSS